MRKLIAAMAVGAVLAGCGPAKKAAQPQSDIVANRKSLGWDLTYQDVLRLNSIENAEWISKWINDLQVFSPNASTGKFQSPIKGLLADWKEDPIDMSILIEYPDHAGIHQTAWFVRTNDRLYYWRSDDGLLKGEGRKALDLKRFDAILEEATKWEQSKKLTAEEYPDIDVCGNTAIVSKIGRAHV
jgi:hypothetical protein